MAKITVQFGNHRHLARINYLYLDGKRMGKISNGEIQSFELTEGDHTLQIRFGLFRIYRSRIYKIAVSGNEEKTFYTSIRKKIYVPAMIIIYLAFFAVVFSKDVVNAPFKEFLLYAAILIAFFFLALLMIRRLSFNIEEAGH